MKIVSYEEFKSKSLGGIPEQVLEHVKKIVMDVKIRGDRAVIEYTERFDGVRISSEDIIVDAEDLKLAYETMPEELKGAILNSARRIRMFQERQMPRPLAMETAPGVFVGASFRPIRSVGFYIPGGRNVYLSTVLMTVVPAKVAGVKKCAMFTPPKKAPSVPDTLLATAYMAGVDEIYRIGGPQAIAAMAYGTETVEKVEKIVGPGNIYVTAAKMLVSWDVAIDMPAGPSELMIYVDGTRSLEWLAADILAQAEHDPKAKLILITPEREIATRVNMYVEKGKEYSQRRNVLEESLSEAFIVLVKDRNEALKLINEVAPEHLELVCDDPESMLDSVENAGAVFIGEYSPVAIGDYTAGTNHVLPTMGWAKRSSPLSVCDFLKSIEVVKCTKEGLKNIGKDGLLLAEAEGMTHHARSIALRM
ncbi:MAG: histidinol dehydrogenase [Candidatus Methanomethylicaceae archaeon]